MMDANDFPSPILDAAGFNSLTVTQLEKNLPHLESLLSADNYLARNGCVEAFGKVIEQVMERLTIKDGKVAAHEAVNEPLNDEAELVALDAAELAEEKLNDTELSEHIFGILVARIHDINSFTRAKTFKTLASLIRSKKVPDSAFVSFVRAGADRLMDKTASVRRAAIQLLTAAMEENPFDATLKLEHFQQKLQEKIVLFKKQIQTTKLQQRQEQTIKEEDEETKADSDADEEMKQKMADEVDDADTNSANPTEQSVKTLLASSVVKDLAVEKSRAEIERFFHAITFIQTLVNVVPILGEMFMSKTSTDATESIAFFVAAKQFFLSGSPSQPVSDAAAAPASESADQQPRQHVHALTVDGGCKKMGGLIWSREPSTRDAVLAAWQKLYFHSDLDAPTGSPQQKRAALVSIHSLLQLVMTSNLSELTSLEEIMTKLFYSGAVPNIMIDSAWELFTSDSSNPQVRAGLLTLLNYFSNASGTILSSHVQELIEIGLSSTALTSAPQLVRATCVALQKWQHAIRAAPTPAQAPPQLSPKTQAIILQRLEVLLLNTPTCAIRASAAWYSMSEQVLNTIFILHSTPEQWMEVILHQLLPTIFVATPQSETTLGNGEKLSRFLFLLSHTAMRTLVHLETLEKEIKAINSKRATAGHQTESEKQVAPPPVEDEQEQTKSKRKKKAVADAPASAEPNSIEDELASNAAAEYELEQRREFAEQRLIQLDATGRGLLSVFGPIVEQLVLTMVPGPTFGRYATHSNLLVNGVMALCKFMTINVEYCEAQLRLLFSVLQAPTTEPTIKGNIIIALGDLFLRFPNSIEPYSEHMYHGLKKHAPTTTKKSAPLVGADSMDEIYVRKNTLMVLKHLILNDMLKAKGPIAEIAKCTQDVTSDPRISELSQAFFQELNNKVGDSKATIYNILPDILSRLSTDPTVTKAQFQDIFKFLLGFIQKDKQLESLIEKLLNRFEFADVSQSRDLSYCLTQLTFNLVSIKKLSTSFRCYSQQLGDEQVFQHFITILTKMRKSLATKSEGTSAAALAKEKDGPELLTICDELETRWTGLHDKLVEDARVTEKATHARGKKGYNDKLIDEVDVKDVNESTEEKTNISSTTTSSRAKTAANKSKAKPKPKSKSTSRRRKSTSDDDDEEEDDEEEEVEEEDEPSSSESEAEVVVRPAKKGGKVAPVKKPAAKKAPTKKRTKKVIGSDEDDDE